MAYTDLEAVRPTVCQLRGFPQAVFGAELRFVLNYRVEKSSQRPLISAIEVQR